MIRRIKAEERIELFNNYFSKINRKGKEELFSYLTKETDFFIAPGSTNYHCNYEGGLLEHSINVVNYAMILYRYSKSQEYPEIEQESIVISALFHDLCKVNVYKKEKLWTKIHGKWAQYDGYKYEDSLPLGHGNKSAYLLSKYIELTKEELLAIVHHMNCFSYSSGYNPELMSAQEASKIPLVRLIAVADISASLIEETIDYKVQCEKINA